MTSNSLSMVVMEPTTAAEKKASPWQLLYQLGGAAAMAGVLIIPITVIVYIVWPPADSVIGHFEQFNRSWLLGLLGMDLLYLLTNIILIPTWLALYVALRRINESWMPAASGSSANSSNRFRGFTTAICAARSTPTRLTTSQLQN